MGIVYIQTQIKHMYPLVCQNSRSPPVGFLLTVQELRFFVRTSVISYRGLIAKL